MIGGIKRQKRMAHRLVDERIGSGTWHMKDQSMIMSVIVQEAVGKDHPGNADRNYKDEG